MIRSYAIIRESAQRVGEAIDHATEAFLDGRVEQEPAFTDRMLGTVEEAMRGYRVKGVTWTAKTLTDRGPHSQERVYGADFMGVLSIDLPDFSVKKGFLAQAKMARNARDPRLREQCERMLKLSPASFVFLYDQRDVSVVPAISVVGADVSPTELYSRSASRFFEEHFESFIGDRAISAPTPKTLERLRLRYETPRLLYLQARAGFPGEFTE